MPATARRTTNKARPLRAARGRRAAWRRRRTLPPDAQIVELPTEAPLAAAIARIALARFLADPASAPAALDANYVRRSDPELLWKE
jgi:hypothetical protein